MASRGCPGWRHDIVGTPIPAQRSISQHHRPPPADLWPFFHDKPGHRPGDPCRCYLGRGRWSRDWPRSGAPLGSRIGLHRASPTSRHGYHDPHPQDDDDQDNPDAPTAATEGHPRVQAGLPGLPLHIVGLGRQRVGAGGEGSCVPDKVIWGSTDGFYRLAIHRKLDVGHLGQGRDLYGHLHVAAKILELFLKWRDKGDHDRLDHRDVQVQLALIARAVKDAHGQCMLAQRHTRGIPVERKVAAGLRGQYVAVEQVVHPLHTARCLEFGRQRHQPAYQVASGEVRQSQAQAHPDVLAGRGRLAGSVVGGGCEAVGSGSLGGRVPGESPGWRRHGGTLLAIHREQHLGNAGQGIDSHFDGHFTADRSIGWRCDKGYLDGPGHDQA